ncbi:MAG: YtxH domain-containing protein [Paludibacteraceae bacterium]|jgi:gas vesicle protein|nr:YtxH domain-containing protein [Paludibacteraceae bacterium]
MANSAGKVLAAFIGGAAMGAIAALLLAPKSGAELRQEITDIVREKGIKLNKEELEALCSKVIAKVKDYCSLEELEEAVEDALKEKKEKKEA